MAELESTSSRDAEPCKSCWLQSRG
jgi:hypothetical protein